MTQLNFHQSGFLAIRAKWISAIMKALCAICAIVIVALLLLIGGYLFYLGFTSLNLDFFRQLPTGDPDHPGGMKHAIYGTIVLVALASMVGIPAGLLTGIFLAEYAGRSWFGPPVRFISDVLAGVPSIVVGILGYELLVVPFATGTIVGVPIPGLFHLGGITGYNGWAGALALAFIMVPIVARTAEEMLLLVPSSYREASIALGNSKAGTVLKVVVPAATGSLVTGVMLAIARVAGETAPLLFTALSSRFLRVLHEPAPGIHPSEINQPFPSLTVQIFNYSTAPNDSYHRLAWGGIVILMLLILALNLTIRFATRERRV